MTIAFEQVPANIRVPGAYIEVSNVRNNTFSENQRILVFGQRLSTGTIAAGVPVLVTSYSQACTYFGKGSMLAEMFKFLFDNNPFTEKWAIAVDDNGAGTAASGTVTITASSALAGTISLYIGGVLVETAVAAGDSASTIATAMAAAINANFDLPVTASADTGVVTVTYRHKGLVGNKLDMRVNYRGLLAGEALPSGVTVAIVQLASGASDPSMTSAIAAIPEERFHYWLIPYISSTILGLFDTEMNARWNPLQMLHGHVFTADKGSVGTLSTLGNTRNNQHMTLLDAANGSPTSPHLWASACCGQVALAASIDPARPFNTLPLIGVLAAVPENRRTKSENNTLLYDGIATHNVSRTGEVSIQRLVTCYQLNSRSVADASYLDANTLFTLSRFVQELEYRMLQRFPRHKLADDGTRFGAGQAIATPKIVRAEIIALAREWEDKAWLENIDTFIQELIVERNTDDRNRLDTQIPTNLVNQFHIFAAQIAFIV